MNKATKGALAAVAGGSLLLGGAGTLAFWSGTSDVEGDSIDSGKLTLSAPDCTDDTVAGTHGWQFDGGSPFTVGTSKVVPGDTISKICDMTLVVEGDHIGAELALDTPIFTADAGNTLDTELQPTATFKVNDATYAPIAAPGTYVVQATVTVEFPDSVETTTGQDVAAVLENMTLTATQTHDAT